MNHFHNKNGLADTCAAEKSYLAALGIRNKKIYDLESCFKKLINGALFVKRGCLAVNCHAFIRFYLTLAVNRSAENIDNSAYYTVTDGNGNSAAVSRYPDSASESFGSFERNGTNLAAAEM